jgi:ferrous iron transport protein A
MVPLKLMKVGDKVRVMAITGTDAVRKHLGSLGFIAGVVVSVVQVTDGSMIIGVHDSRIAINPDVAARVMVRPE